MSGLATVTDTEFQAKVVKGPRPAMVKFSAEWCGPCKAIAPAVEELAKTYAGKVDIFEMDTDASPDTASTLGVMSVPTFVFYKGGQEVGRMVGASRPRIEEALKKLVG